MKKSAISPSQWKAAQVSNPYGEYWWTPLRNVSSSTIFSRFSLQLSFSVSKFEEKFRREDNCPQKCNHCLNKSYQKGLKIFVEKLVVAIYLCIMYAGMKFSHFYIAFGIYIYIFDNLFNVVSRPQLSNTPDSHKGGHQWYLIIELIKKLNKCQVLFLKKLSILVIVGLIYWSFLNNHWYLKWVRRIKHNKFSIAVRDCRV